MNEMPTVIKSREPTDNTAPQSAQTSIPELTNHAIELLRITEVCEITKLSKATIWNKLNPDSKYYDPSFPKQVNLSKKAVAWYRHEILDWIMNLRINELEESIKKTLFEKIEIEVPLKSIRK